jgi:hypothetical protein
MLQHSKILNQLYSSFIILNNEILTMGQGYLVIIILYILCNITCLIFVISSYYLGVKNLLCLRSDLLFKSKKSIIFENPF